ncbi:hydrolase [Pseudomonas duriflava]|nr:hydrolase [Pseudomonas duriflava]
MPQRSHLSEPNFTPAWWLPSAHLQTLWGSLWRRIPLMTRPRERLWLADGDFLDLDWYGPDDPSAPVVLAIHGLTGSSSSHYILGLQLALARQGWACVGLNWRGCSGEPNLLPRGYHSGVTEDLAAVIDHLQAKRPKAPLYAVGYSLGGNVLLKYVGETGTRCPLKAAVSVSVPFRLDLCADRIGIGFSRIYQAHFMRELVAYVRRKRQALEQRQQHEHLASLDALGTLENMRTFWDFDGRITAPLHGFLDAQDYYRRASSRYYLGGMRIPTLMIQAEDDPFIGIDSLPEPAELSDCTTFERHEHGGHVGFIGGSWRNPDYYLERRIPSWLADRQAEPLNDTCSDS